MTEASHWLSAAEQQAWRSFLRVQDKLLTRLARELQNDSGLSAADYGVLVNLTDVPEGRLPMLELARTVEWEKSRMSHHIARMEKRGLVAREECAGDKRVAFVAITPEGREAIEAAAPRHVAAVRRLVVAPLTPAELAMLGQISDRILEELEREPSSGGQ
ncbi:MarR family winged helix-turn-helix transcriptional regulator [Streptomyces sp. NPDC094448]|uniref:MarR family winged helix-turn-helix transcriptional regulator n=1 Tax=Streptomyces sp. NPDC094448 TaxID=3366063 RepID=UPI00381ACC2B